MAEFKRISTDRRIAGELAVRTRAARGAREAEVATVRAATLRNDPAPDVELEHRRVDALKSAARRVRRIDQAHVAEVARSIQAFGFTVPLLISGDGSIVDGHVRHEAAKALGLDTVPCIVVDHLSKAEQSALKIAVNRMAEKGSWDFDSVKLELAAITDLDLTLTGFSFPEIDIILSLDDDEPATKPEPELTADDGPPATRAGDIWLLGPHRLLCGDATNPDAYDRLMAGKIAAAVFTDPPYNCPIDGFVSQKGKHEDFAMGVGEMSEEQFRTFLFDVLGNAGAKLDLGGAVFACMDWRQLYVLTAAAKTAGLTHINTVVWDKGVGGMGGLYRSAHEMIMVFVNGDTLKTNNVELGKHGRDRCNVWHYAGANRKGSSANKMLGEHPTPKPLELVRDAILDVTNRGDIVLDPFLGSGTTIMAAEACGRIGYGMELDPRYADVIVRRWLASGGEATLEGSDQSFEATGEQRAASAT